MYNQKDIIDEIVSISGLYEKVFGKLLNKLVYKQNFENKKHVLKTIYGFTDIEKIFDKQIERKEFLKLSNIVFRYSDNSNQNNNNGFFSKNGDPKSN